MVQVSGHPQFQAATNVDGIVDERTSSSRCSREYEMEREEEGIVVLLLFGEGCGNVEEDVMMMMMMMIV